jgi:hypothetical protein
LRLQTKTGEKTGGLLRDYWVNEAATGQTPRLPDDFDDDSDVIMPVNVLNKKYF